MIRVGTDNHPDSAWARSVSAAMDAWCEAGPKAPTSQVVGGGAVEAAERAFSALHDNRPALLMPSATYGMRSVLQASGVGPGDEVLIPGYDWPSTLSAVSSVGAVPILVPVDPCTLTMAPEEAAYALTGRTKAVVVCHLHGVAADVPAIRAAVGPRLPIIEDAAQALGCYLDGTAVGTLADAAVFSFGPGKLIDAGEAGMVLTGTRRLHKAVVREACHPARQLLTGIFQPLQGAFSIRPHPVSAILVWQALATLDFEGHRRNHQSLAAQLADIPGVDVLGVDGRRLNAAVAVPTLCLPGADMPSIFDQISSGAQFVGPDKSRCRQRSTPRQLILIRARQQCAQSVR